MTRGDLVSGREDRALGALLGLAVGDALGTTLEFSSRDSRPLQTEMRGGGPFQLKAGRWTDDTSMALALAESLAANSDFDPLDLMTRFVSWYETGAYSCTGTCFDIGVTTRQALHRFKATGNPFAGAENPRSAGNGSIMRLAPVALNSLGDRAEASRIARDQSRTTHAAAQCVEACDFLVQILLDAIDGAGKAALEARSWSGDEAIVRIASGAWRSKSRREIASSGYVIATLEAALWSVATTDSLEEALILAVNLGDDADTVGAVTGQIAGAVYGAAAIPTRWLQPLAWRERIEGLARELADRDRSGPAFQCSPL